ncbi:MAG: FHA domain-containing protein [Deltaproteobacteria bacterium]|jgi:hypothetical protein|nr:FHA domain-containing protein [Deltaproteobacteria bacterium]
MALVKYCSRGHKNPPEAIMCLECLEDLSRLEPAEDTADNLSQPQLTEAISGDLNQPELLVEVEILPDEIDPETSDAVPLPPPTVRSGLEDPVIIYPESESGLSFMTEDGQKFSAATGDIIGRAETGGHILQKYPTVSRLHFRLFQRQRGWIVKNLSDNGTWVNDLELAVGEEVTLNPGDELRLSSRCRLKVLP